MTLTIIHKCPETKTISVEEPINSPERKTQAEALELLHPGYMVFGPAPDRSGLFDEGKPLG